MCFLLFFFSSTVGVNQRFSLDSLDYIIFHSPYCKLVQKSVARLALNDFLAAQHRNMPHHRYTGLDAFR